MRRVILAIASWLASTHVHAHEMTPTYFDIKQSIYTGVVETSITVFNRREDASFYRLEVYDQDWNRIPFYSDQKTIRVDYLESNSATLYFKASDTNRIMYICTLSKLRREDVKSAGVSSRICSKVKE